MKYRNHKVVVELLIYAQMVDPILLVFLSATGPYQSEATKKHNMWKESYWIIVQNAQEQKLVATQVKWW